MNGSDANVDRLHEDNNITIVLHWDFIPTTHIHIKSLFTFLMVTKNYVIFDAAESVFKQIH